jgi:hypothetical protein
MNILSLDLDFFMHGIVHNRSDSNDSRPDDHVITPWEAEAVLSFLHDSLNLRASRPGREVCSHHEVFFAWRDAIARKILRPPFFVCHVDAHSDLGMGTASWVYLHSDFLELEVSKRAYPREGKEGLNLGSFMSYAIGNRWISRVDFVASESWCDDIPRCLLSDSSLSHETGSLKPNVELEVELMHVPRDTVRGLRYRSDICTEFKKVRKSVGEPSVPFSILDGKNLGGRYSAYSWDFVFLSRSPGYVPTSGDELLPGIRAYIKTF